MQELREADDDVRYEGMRGLTSALWLTLTLISLWLIST